MMCLLTLLKGVSMENNIPFEKIDKFLKELFSNEFYIEKVIYHNPATIILWSDGIKTVVKCNKEDEFDKEKGLAMAIVKRLSGNKGNYYNIFKEFCK